MTEVSTKQKELRELERQIDEARGQLSRNLNAINEAKAEMQEVEQERVNLGRKIEEDQRRAAEYEGRRVELETRLHELTEQIRDDQRLVSELETSVAALRKEEEDFRAARPEREAAERERLADLFAAERADLDRVRAVKEVEQDMRDAAIEERRTIERDLEGLQERMNERTAELAALSRELAELSEEGAKKRAAHEREVATMNDTINSLSESVKTLTSQAAELDTAIAAKTAEAAGLDARIRELNAQAAEARKQYDLEKGKLFGIAERERRLTQKEEYIRQKYKDAGIEF